MTRRGPRVLSALVAGASTVAALRHRPQLRAVYLADAAVQTFLASLAWRRTTPSAGDA